MVNALAIGTALTEARLDAHFTQEHVAAKMRERGYTTNKNTISRWESTGSIALAFAIDLCEILNVPVDQIVTRSFAVQSPDPEVTAA